MATKPTTDAEEEAPPPDDREWVSLRDEYVTTPITLAELATKYSIPGMTVRWHSAREGWVAKRQLFLDETSTEIRRKLSLRYANDAIKDYDRLEAATGLIVRQLLNGKPVKFVGKDEDGNSKIIEFTADLAVSSMEAGAAALVNLVKAKAVMAGEPGEVTKTAVDVNARVATTAQVALALSMVGEAEQPDGSDGSGDTPGDG